MDSIGFPDFIRLRVPIWENPGNYIQRTEAKGVSWDRELYSLNNGREYHTLCAKKHGIEAKLSKTTGELVLEGSIHKFSNDGRINWDNPGRERLWKAIETLCDLFLIDPKEARITKLEHGVNIPIDDSLPVDTAKGITESLLFYKQTPFHKCPLGEHLEAGSRRRSDFLIKAYDKGLQVRETENEYFRQESFRLEVKHQKGKKLKKLGVRHLSDLLDPRRLDDLDKHLLECWDQIVLREKALPDTPEHLLNKFHIYKYPGAWNDLKRERGDKAFRRKRKEYHTYVKDHTYNLYQRIRDKMLGGIKNSSLV